MTGCGSTKAMSPAQSSALQDNVSSAKAADETYDPPVRKVSYEDGLAEDGLIYAYLVGTGEKADDFKSQFIDYLIYYEANEHLIISMYGKEYVFANISKEMWEEFKQADSKGHFYNERLRDSTEYWITDYDGTNGNLIRMVCVDDYH